jgi:two-component system, NarL family, sensor histidine kinase DesK
LISIPGFSIRDRQGVSIHRESEDWVQAEPQPSEDERHEQPVRDAPTGHLGLAARLTGSAALAAGGQAKTDGYPHVTTSLAPPGPALEAPPPARLSQLLSTPAATGAAARPQVLGQAERSSRVASAAAAVVAIAFPLLHVAYIFVMPEGGYERGMWALAAVAAYLPLHVRHVWFAARATRPPGGIWTMTAMAAIIIGALPLAGTAWVMEFSWLAVSVLIVLRRPWSYVIAIGLVAAAWPVALLIGDRRNAAAWYALAAANRGATLFVLVWLAAAIQRLREARLALAEEAVTRERLRIDGELRHTLGAALESIVARGQWAAAQVAGDCAPLDTELRALIEDSRATLARARSMVHSYQQVSLRAELDTAVALLSAVGIETRLSLPHGDLPDDIALRAGLRTALVRLLRDDTPPRYCLIMVTREDGQTRLELRTDRGSPGTSAVVAA